MEIQIGIGELVDKYTILAIKSLKVNDVEKRANIVKEWHILSNKMIETEGLKLDALTSELLYINNELWTTEDALRECEKEQNFGDHFINLARSVYKLNDKRADIKKKINIKYNSDVIEEKSYTEY